LNGDTTLFKLSYAIIKGDEIPTPTLFLSIMF